MTGGACYERDRISGRSGLLSSNAEVIADARSEKPFVTANVDLHPLTRPPRFRANRT